MDQKERKLWLARKKGKVKSKHGTIKSIAVVKRRVRDDDAIVIRMGL